MSLANAEAICRQRGLRFTPLRRKVLTLIWCNHKPTKAYDLMPLLNAEEPIDKRAVAKPPTVYRALDFLLQTGLVHRIESLNAYLGCSHPLRHRDCYFLICSSCGEIEECCEPEITRAIAETTSRFHFKSSYTQLEIKGLCDHCNE